MKRCPNCGAEIADAIGCPLCGALVEDCVAPDVDDVKEGVIASKIAAHVGDLCRGIGRERDSRMAKARKALDWSTMFGTCIDEEKARRYRCRGCTEESEGCSMCGDICAIKIVDTYMKKG